MLLRKRIPLKYVGALVWKEMIAAMIIAGSISYYDEYFEDWGLVFPIVDMAIPSLLGTMITLILAFRMNQSYERWWEGRKVWGGIVNDTRALIREVSFLSTREQKGTTRQAEFSNEMISMAIIWPNELVKELRGLEGKGESPRMRDSLKEELGKLNVHVPAGLLHIMQSKINEAYQDGVLNDYQQVQLTDTLNRLGEHMGKAERIKKTVFPHLYSILIDAIIWVFVFLLPLAYRDPNKYFEFPVSMMICTVFIVLEKLAERLQDPFDGHPTDIPIQEIANSLDRYGAGILGDSVSPIPSNEDAFFVM